MKAVQAAYPSNEFNNEKYYHMSTDFFIPLV